MKSIFKIYSGQYLPRYGTPLIIIAVDMEGEGHYFTEHYILFPSKPLMLSTRYRVDYDPEDTPPDFLSIDDVIASELESARAHFENHFYTAEKALYNKVIFPLHPFTEIDESKVRPLVTCRIRGLCENELAKIRENTRCKELKRYLGKIMQIPKMVFTKIK